MMLESGGKNEQYDDTKLSYCQLIRKCIVMYGSVFIISFYNIYVQAMVEWGGRMN